MNILKKVSVFLKLNMKTKLLFIEAFIYLGWARFLKTLPFSKISPSLGHQMKETPLTVNLSNDKVLKDVAQAIHIMSRYTFWESQCLVKAIAGMKMLEKRKVESTLYLGTAKDENGKLIAHAWLRSGPFFISGAEGKEKFTIVAKFAKEISMKKREGENYG
ncbi:MULTISPECIES: lasso peptide biosynthesis B2 protein [Priestia]|uniref:lasso peptide biosynthesis B2 protein n=1 Tax=Priestia TaxID=2800373 RepID=UPI00232FD147|nr:lasso peptide biosynthesis B2 protein [Priestia sp. AB]MDC0702979.1 lasso peptide biosynthesis B2 protein [Priestia sp. AB]